MNKEDLLKYIVQGTRGGKVSKASKPAAKSMKPKKAMAAKPAKGKAKSGYMAHVKKFSKEHPNLTWRECMVKAKSSYKAKGSAMAGSRAGARAAAKPNLRKAASKVNKGLRDTKAISKTLRALSMVPTPISGVANDVSALANALGYGKMPKRRLRR